MKTRLILVCLLSATALHAGPRSSTNYNIATDTTDGGGKRSTSASYTNDGSAGGNVGISTVAAPAETAKHGYIGQLTEVTALQLAATPTTVNETATRQLNGVQLLDDLTTVTVPAASITWSIVSGPLSSISTGGLATAETVYQDTAATAQGIYAGNTDTLGLTVLNSMPDNYGTYAGDGIGDDWQVQFFGIGNPNAGPLVDFDHDGVLNLMEFGTGMNPTLAGIIPMEMVKNGAALEFTYPRASTAMAQGLGFIVEWSDTLPGPNPWSIVGVTQQILSDNGTVQQVKATVPAGSNGSRFVHLKVTAP